MELQVELLIMQDKDCNDCVHHTTNSKYPEGISDKCFKCLGHYEGGELSLPFFSTESIRTIELVESDWPYLKGESYFTKIMRVINPKGDK